MKKIVLYAVLIIAAVFYIAQTSFAESSIFDTDGFVFSGKEVQENLFKSSDGDEVDAIGVKAQEKIYSRGNTLYVGEKTKKQLNIVFPMYINDGAAIKMMSGKETLITSDFQEVDAYEGLIINEGTAFNDNLERADWNDYILVRLSNGLYINSGVMEVKTYLHNKSIPSNSICYFTPEFIRYYYNDNGTFRSGVIGDVDYQSIIKIRDVELTYYDFLLSLNEIDKEKDKNNFIKDDEQVTEDEPEPTEHEKNNGVNKGDEDNAEADDGEKTEPKEPQKPETPPPAEKVEDVKPSDPAAPAPTPITPPPTKPDPPKEDDSDLEIKYPDWKIPVVTPGAQLNAGVYTLRTTVKVDDPAGVIVGGITYEICMNEGSDIGKVYKRTAIAAESGQTTDVIISGLKPDYNFTVRGYFKYKDKYGRVQSEVVVFLETKEFKTKELSELGTIKLENFELNKANYFPNKIEIPNLKFTSDSDIDAMGSLSQVIVRFKGEGETQKQATILPGNNLETLMGRGKVYFVSNKDLKSNTKYDIEVACYDRFGNQLEVEGNTATSRTCKNLPKAKLTVDVVGVKQVDFTLSLTEIDDIEYKNLRLVIRDAQNKIVKIKDKDYVTIEPDKKITVDSLGSNKVYFAYILCDCDINDGKGEREQELVRKSFTTSSIAQMGSLYITGVDRTSEKVDGVPYNRAVIGISLNTRSTDPDLPQFVSVLTMYLKSEEEEFSVSLTPEQTEKFIKGEEILLDTDNFTAGLSSNTTYKVSFKSQYKSDDGDIDIKTSCNLKTIKTPRRPVEIELKNVQAYTGFIEAEVRISDVDGVIEGDTAILQVRKQKKSSTVLVGAFRVEKNATEFYKIGMYADSSMSTDGKSYDIESETTYLLRIIAEEANTDEGLKTNYVLFEKELNTGKGVTGKVYLHSLNPISGSKNFTAKVLVNVDDPSEWLADKTCYVDIYRKTSSGSKYLETKTLKYNGTGTNGTPLSFEMEVEYSAAKTNKYEFSLYIKPNENIRIPLSFVDFSTEEQIYTISSGEQFAKLGTSDKKYVVICDISYKNNNSHYQKGPWGKSAFRGNVDFQGFSFDLTGHNVFMNELARGGSISNMILRNHSDYSKTRNGAQSNNDNGVFLNTNRGVLSNIKVEYDETEFPPYKTNTYWSDTEDHFKIAQDSSNPESKNYRYEYPLYTTALVGTNFNIIENFAVELKTVFTTSYVSGCVARQNNGTIRNGYVYGSDADNNYMAEIEIYNNTAGNGAKNEKLAGVIVGKCETGAFIENVYALANITEKTSGQSYNAIICGQNKGKISSSYSVGDVMYNGKVVSSHGPANILNGGQANNVYYVSNNSYSTSGNLYASIVALKNIMWQEGLLNSNTRKIKGFDVRNLIDINCYPQVLYTSQVMPVQDYIPLPEIQKTSKVDLLLSDTYVPDPENELNSKLEPFVEGNQAWDRPDENGRTYQTQVAVMQISDRSARDVYSVDIGNLKSEVVGTYKDGSGITTVYVKVSEPQVCVSSYPLNSITFADYAGNKGQTYNFSDRYVNIKYYWRVFNEKGSVDSWSKVNSKNTENFVLMNDLDFADLSVKDAYVSNQFYGILDGNGHEIRNIEYDECLYNTLGNNKHIGLFCTLSGTVKDLTLRNINFESGMTAGTLAAFTSKATVESVYSIGGYITGDSFVGGLIGRATSTTITNCGVTDTKIVNTSTIQSSNYNTNSGGLVGDINGGVNVSRSFVQNVYIESMMPSKFNASQGGLTGNVQGNGNTIVGCYATGTIHASADGTGGLVGVLNSANAIITDTYADVDIYAYNGSAGGLVGRAFTTLGEETAGLSFGNIISGVLMDSNDQRRSTYGMVCLDSGYVIGYYYAGAKLILDNSGTNYASTAAYGRSSFTYDQYANDDIYAYISDSYFVTEDDRLLPKLTDSDGNVLPNQNDEYVDLERAVGDVSISLTDKGNQLYDIDMAINHDEGVRVNGVYTDFTYVDKNLGLDGELIFESFTKKKAFAKSPVYVRGTAQTRVEIHDTTLESYYDIYTVNGIMLTVNGQNTLVRVGDTLDIGQQFCEISSIDEWKSKVMGSYCENFRITGDIDFTGVTLKKYDGTANTMINRLVGSKGVSGDYTKESPYWDIRNANLKPGGVNQLNEHLGVQYSNTNGLIRGIVSQCSNITFKDIEVNVTSQKVGVIATATGKIDGVIFDNCTVKADHKNMESVGMIGLSNGRSNNVQVKDCEVTGGSWVGGYIGTQNARKYNTGVTNVKIDNAEVTAKQSYCGGAVGQFFNGRFQYWGDTSNKRSSLEYCNVFNSSIYAADSNAGGIIGAADTSIINECTVEGTTVSAAKNTAGGISAVLAGNSEIKNCRVNDISVEANGNNAGGISGTLNKTNALVSYSYVYDSKIKANYNAGGAVGSGEVVKQVYVDSCTVVAKNGEAGGISGAVYDNDTGISGNLAATDSTGKDPTANSVAGIAINTKVYGSKNVGGAVGNSKRNLSKYIVKDCEIRGYQDVGGIAGRVYNGQTISQGYCENSLITTMTDDMANANEITKLNPPEIKYFGGIVGRTDNAVISYCMTDGCVIGSVDKPVNHVGGIAGYHGQPSGTNNSYFNIAQNSVVAGNYAVGGLIGVGVAYNYNAKGTRLMAHSYSNCLLVGNSAVGGLVGELYNDRTTTTSDGNVIYAPMPQLSQSYYSGAIKSTGNASAIYGRYSASDAAANVNTSLSEIMSLPQYIEANSITPVSMDDEKGWQQLIKSTGNHYVSLWAETELRDSGGKKKNTMGELLDDSKYNPYVSDRAKVQANWGKGFAGDPFIFTYANATEVKKNAYAWGINQSGWFDYKASYEFMPLARSNTSAFETGQRLTIYNNKTLSNVMANPFTGNKVSITMKQGVHFPGTAEYDAEIKGMEDMYDALKGGKLGNLGIGVTGQASSSAAQSAAMGISDMGVDLSTYVKTYAVDADKINIEFEPELYDLIKDTGRVTLYADPDDTGSALIDNAPVDRRTYTIEYGFRENLRLDVSFEVSDGSTGTIALDIYPANLSQRIMLYNGEGYYITDGGLYKASDQSLLLEGDFINMAGGKVLDSAGNIYSVGTAADTGAVKCGSAGETGLIEETLALYQFSYEGNKVKTYGTYSSVTNSSETKISADMRLYEKNGQLIALKNNINAVSDGIFAYFDGDDSYILTLLNDGTIKSLGSVPLLDRLNGFTNSGVMRMASNMNSGGTTLLIERNDGSISGYDILTGEEIFRTEAVNKVSLSEYISDFVAGLFSLNRGGLEQSKKEVDGLIAVMEQSELSLDEVLEVLSEELESETLEAGTADEILSQIDDLMPSENSIDEVDRTDNSGGVYSVDTADSAGDSDSAYNADGAYNTDVASGGISENTPVSYAAAGKKEYISVYDADKNDFEIYETAKLMDNPEQAVSETEKIVDKSRLKAMYKALSEGDDSNSTRGMIMYVIVVLAIAALFITVIASRRKQKDQK